ncbi:hypothetical protein M9H77_29723 [Catharanthus roseus]|uniref:Uncharacterized protein n=1 Tax=Catharanthus roseus TaxID=4058 RepID=A0ACB9ZW54_CATRO|nr:hypothetical protein M9H77_29723 [Catharanthus roseus]
MLFWNSKIARNAYGPYFTGVVRRILPTNRMISHNELVSKILKYRDMDPNLYIVRMTMRMPSYYEVHCMFYFNIYSMNNDEEMLYLWTIPPHHAKEEIHILVEFDQIQQHSILITQEINTTNMTEHITAVTQMVSDEPSILYPPVNDDDDKIDQSDEDDIVSSQSESDDDNEPGERELQTPVNPVIENIMPQWESIQWFSSARNLSSKFISMLISHLVANDPEIPVSNIIQEVQVLFQTGCTYKWVWYARKFAIEKVFAYELAKYEQASDHHAWTAIWKLKEVREMIQHVDVVEQPQKMVCMQSGTVGRYPREAVNSIWYWRNVVYHASEEEIPEFPKASQTILYRVTGKA